MPSLGFQPEGNATELAAASLQRVELQEWKPKDLLLSPAAVAELSVVQSSILSVQLLPNGLTRLTPGPIIGHIRIGSIEIVISPKTPIPMLLLLLAEVHDLARIIPTFAGYALSADLVDLLIGAFLRLADDVIRKGLKRAYVSREDELVPVRGRVDIRQTTAIQMRGRARVWCSYEDYSADCPENRALLATLNAIAENRSLLPERRQLAHRLAADFSEVSPVRLHGSDIAQISCDRLSTHYEPALHLARVILDGMGLVNTFGGVQSSGFLLDMNQLFEQFIFRRLSRILWENQITVEQQVTISFDEDDQAIIRPDLVIRGRSGGCVIADTKYKAITAPEPNDLYQMLAYCRVFNVRHGIIITLGHATRSLRVRDGQTTIDLQSVSLDGTGGDIEHSMEKLAGHIKTILGY
jgi:5-methylcytosine-specific restriction enzyme subunit McrC